MARSSSCCIISKWSQCLISSLYILPLITFLDSFRIYSPYISTPRSWTSLFNSSNFMLQILNNPILFIHLIFNLFYDIVPLIILLRWNIFLHGFNFLFYWGLFISIFQSFFYFPSWLSDLLSWCSYYLGNWLSRNTCFL